MPTSMARERVRAPICRGAGDRMGFSSCPMALIGGAGKLRHAEGHGARSTSRGSSLPARRGGDYQGRDGRPCQGEIESGADAMIAFIASPTAAPAPPANKEPPRGHGIGLPSHCRDPRPSPTEVGVGDSQGPLRRAINSPGINTAINKGTAAIKLHTPGRPVPQLPQQQHAGHAGRSTRHSPPTSNELVPPKRSFPQVGDVVAVSRETPRSPVPPP